MILLGPASNAGATDADAHFAISVEVSSSCIMSDTALPGGTARRGDSHLRVTCSTDTAFGASAGRSEAAFPAMAGSAGPAGVTIAYAVQTAFAGPPAAAPTPLVFTVTY